MKKERKEKICRRTGSLAGSAADLGHETEEESMRFRPCIDIHNGKVKQIVGGSLKDEGNKAKTNFSSELGASFYAELYRKDRLKGGHVIMLNSRDSEYYGRTRQQALDALHTYPGGLQAGGGVTADNAKEYLAAGASHVIVTSYVFQNGVFHEENLEALADRAGKEHVVLDLSCRKKEDGHYYVVTDRWQKFTDMRLTHEVLNRLAGYCDEFLVHGVDVEGKRSGMETELVRMLSEWDQIPVTYAGGIGSLDDLEQFRNVSRGRLDFTIGSALDLFGGNIPYEKIKDMR